MVVKGAASKDWREERRQAARATILDAAWSLVEESGLAAVSMRDLAQRAGITTPTLYAYFESKNAVFDEMFAQSAALFDVQMSASYDADDLRELLRAMAHRFVAFCLSDVGRYQLLFQRTIPGFEPSAHSFAHAVAALEHTRSQLAVVGVNNDWQIDLLTALITGLVDQQISNDPGGDRWTRLLDDAIEMFVTYCQRTARVQHSSSPSTAAQSKEAPPPSTRRRKTQSERKG